MAQGKNQLLKQNQQEQKDLIAKLNNDISTQKELIKTTKEQLQFWRKNKKDIHQSSRVDELSEQIATQETTLNQLQLNKQNIINGANLRAQEINNDTDSKLNDVKYTKAQLLDEINIAKNNLKAIQGQKDRGQKNTDSLNSQIGEANQSANLIRTHIQSLESSIGQIQNELAQIK